MCRSAQSPPRGIVLLDAKGLLEMPNPARPAADCRTMAEIRAEIDRLDSLLVSLLAERQSYIERAAQVKTVRSAVHDQARIDDVIAKVLAAARSAGLSSAIAEPVWRTLIDRSIAHEFAAFEARLQPAR